MSEGKFEDVRPDIANTKPTDIDESTDTYDTIDWLLKNVENNNGRVGLTGISYPGFYTSASSIDSHPALKACSPQAPVSDWFHVQNLTLCESLRRKSFGAFLVTDHERTLDDRWRKHNTCCTACQAFCLCNDDTAQVEKKDRFRRLAV